jgi:hypothetical protein
MEKKKLILIILILGLIILAIFPQLLNINFAPDPNTITVNPSSVGYTNPALSNVGCSACIDENCEEMPAGNICTIAGIAWENVQNHEEELQINNDPVKRKKEYYNFLKLIFSCLDQKGYKKSDISRFGFDLYNRQGTTNDVFYKPLNDLQDCKVQAANKKGIIEERGYMTKYVMPQLSVDISLFDDETCKYFIKDTPNKFFTACFERFGSMGHCDKCELKECVTSRGRRGNLETNVKVICHPPPSASDKKPYPLNINPSGTTHDMPQMPLPGEAGDQLDTILFS